VSKVFTGGVAALAKVQLGKNSQLRHDLAVTLIALQQTEHTQRRGQGSPLLVDKIIYHFEFRSFPGSGVREELRETRAAALLPRPPLTVRFSARFKTNHHRMDRSNTT
jgi:hypothetical protein